MLEESGTAPSHSRDFRISKTTRGVQSQRKPREASVNFDTHCLGTIDIPGQVVYLSRSQ